MTAYIITPEQHAQITEHYERLYAEIDLSEWDGKAAQLLRDTLAMLKAMKPVEPSAWMHLTEDGNIRMWSKSSPETIESAIGVKPQALYAKEQQ